MNATFSKGGFYEELLLGNHRFIRFHPNQKIQQGLLGLA